MSVADLYGRPMLRSGGLDTSALDGLDPDLLESFRDVLDGTNSIEEVLGRLLLEGFEVETIFDGLESLDARGLLQESPASDLSRLTEAERALYAEQVSALGVLAEPERLGSAVWSEAGVAAQVRLKHAAVAVVGDGPPGRQLAGHLRDAGIGQAVLSSLAGDESDHERELDQEFAVLVYCPRRFDANRAAKLNAECLARSLPFLPFRQRLLDVELGPLVIPGETACYVCYETRRGALLGEARATLEVPIPQLAFPVGIDLLALEIVKLVSQVAQPLLRGCMWRLSLVSGLLDLHPVLKLPRCVACGVHKQRPARKLWEE